MDSAIPVTRLTEPPGFHWFGYYDKLQFDPASRRILGMAVEFEHRSPSPEDSIRLGLIDLDGDRAWREIGTTRAWCWQQGCMLQWIPGSDRRVIWNDREGDRFVARIVDVVSGERQTLPAPVYALSPNGTEAISVDFRRINHMRPGYGYSGLPDPHADELRPAQSGIDRVDLQTGQTRRLFSIDDVVGIPSPRYEPGRARHYFNHLLFSPDGGRFIFLHRWRRPEQKGFATRMLTADRDGNDLHVVDDYGRMSHFIWRDPEHILGWTWQPDVEWGFYLFRDRSDRVESVGRGVMTVNGHCTYLPGNRWILNDTYPDADRNQEVFLYEVATGRRVSLGRFATAPDYTGEWRCDTHPRVSPDGRRVIIDSPHEALGRQLYLLDISSVVQ